MSANLSEYEYKLDVRKPPHMAARPRFRHIVSLGSNRHVIVRRARNSDWTALCELYDRLYGSTYSLPIIKDRHVFRECISSSSLLWPVTVTDEGQIIGSVVFTRDVPSGLCKIIGGVIDPAWQGHDLMRRSIVLGLDHIIDNEGSLDVVYATTRTVSPAPEKLVRRIGFRSLGIFPNIRRVGRFESHGLNVFFRPGILDRRLRGPRLIPEMAELYRVAREVCDLPDDAILEPLVLPEPEPWDLDFSIIRQSKDVRFRYDRAVEEGLLGFSFFPFNPPHVVLVSKDCHSEVFIHHNEADDYGAIVGLRTDRMDVAGLLHQACQAAAGLGLRYIEMLVSAFDPLKQRQAFDAYFIPCAYFPAMKPMSDGRRMDYVFFSRSYENLDFTQIQNAGDAVRYLDAFMKNWYWHQLRDEPDYEQWIENVTL